MCLFPLDLFIVFVCIAFHAGESTFTHFGSHVIIHISSSPTGAAMKWIRYTRTRVPLDCDVEVGASTKTLVELLSSFGLISRIEQHPKFPTRLSNRDTFPPIDNWSTYSDSFR
jgi:hypothetical protein